MITQEIEKIKNFSTQELAKILNISHSQARRYKKGESGLTNSQALILDDIAGLSPRAFDAIRLCYNNLTKK